MKFRLPSWLSDCSAAIVLLALAAVVLGPAPKTRQLAPGVATYLSAVGAADDGADEQAATRRLIRTEAVRALRGGRSAADRPSGSFPGLPSAAQRIPLVALLAADDAAADSLARSTGRQRPAPRGPPIRG